MEWLYYQNRQMSSGSSSTADRIAHARNRGEHVIRVGAKQIYVDGCVETTNTVCELSVCFYRGCTTCLPNRDQKYAKPEYSAPSQPRSSSRVHCHGNVGVASAPVSKNRILPSAPL